MKPSETAENLAKHIINKSNDAIQGKCPPIEGEEIAQWIEDTYPGQVAGLATGCGLPWHPSLLRSPGGRSARRNPSAARRAS